jgi:hypothetical protein
MVKNVTLNCPHRCRMLRGFRVTVWKIIVKGSHGNYHSNHVNW